jgi:hypothetical protein
LANQDQIENEVRRISEDQEVTKDKQIPNDGNQCHRNLGEIKRLDHGTEESKWTSKIGKGTDKDPLDGEKLDTEICSNDEIHPKSDISRE